MKKKIKDLTIEEKLKICKKGLLEEHCGGCVLFVDFDKPCNGLNPELEVEIDE